jgi:hypothetical protein
LPHDETTREPGKSYLLVDVDAQALFDQYAGRGRLRMISEGRYDNKQIVVADRLIGYAVDPSTGEQRITNQFKIHHSATRTHIVPVFSEDILK